MELNDYLKILATKDGSDLYLSTGAPPAAKFQGKLKPLSKEKMKPGDIKAIAYSLMDATQQEEFERELEMNLATSTQALDDFVSIFLFSATRSLSWRVTLSLKFLITPILIFPNS